MGPEWTLRLSDFFSPYFLETSSATPNYRPNEEEDGLEDVFWADRVDKARCAYLALDALAGSVNIANPKHQQMLGVAVTAVLPSALFWVARGGPAYLVRSTLQLLSRVSIGNPVVGSQIINMTLRLSPSTRGRNIPSSTAVTHELSFGWSPLPNDDRRCIAALSLLAERYVYAIPAWSGKVSESDLRQGSSSDANYSDQIVDVSTAEGFSLSSLSVLDIVLAADASSTGLLVQYVLAPPPPLRDDDDDDDNSREFGTNDPSVLESMRPVASILLGLVIEVCYKVGDSAATVSNPLVLSSAAFKSDLDTAERAANILTLIFLHGGLIARELMTALTTSHIATSSGVVSRNYQIQVFYFY